MLVAIFLNIVSCKHKTEPPTSLKPLFTNDPYCTYSLETKTPISATWTAYKFTEKVAVNGKFTNPKILSTTKQAKTLQDLINSLQVSIQLTEIDSKNPVRDLNIKKAFKKGFSTTLVTAKMNAEKFQSNQITTIFNINKTQKNIVGYLSKAHEAVSSQHNSIALAITNRLDLNDFHGTTFLQEIATACGKELHTGKDGQSKMWPEVRTEIVLHIVKTCQ